MPARKSFQVPTLQDLCFTLVSSNLDFWCNEEHNDNVNPVAKLPNVILDEICKRAMRGDCVRPHHLNMLVHQNTTDLDLNVKPAPIIQRGIELIQNVCTNLTNLNLRGCRISEDCLVELIKSIPKIEILNLQATKAKDKVLKVLGENCPDLRELDLCDTKITDAGIKELCENRPAKDGGKTGGRCRRIEKLGVWEALRITDEGLATALRNLPYLRKLKHENTLTPIAMLYYENNRNYQLKLEKIHYLTRYKFNVSTSTIDAAVALCKNVKKLYLTCLTADDHFWLPSLANFSHAEELSLNGFYPKPSFHACAAPLLRRLGSALKKLAIFSFEGVNLWEIGEYNTNLVELDVRGDGSYPTVIPRPPGINLSEMFTEIREIWLSSNNRIPVDQIETLLANCSHVQSLRIFNCESLTDQVLRRVCNVNSFSELHTLSIGSCNNIHVSSILMFMNTSKVLRLIHCRSSTVTCDEIQELRNIARNENFDLEITWDSHASIFG